MSSNTPPGLHNRIAVLRAERNLSRQDLAQAVDVNYQTIGFLERGDYNPSLTLALDLAAYFHLPVEAIFSRTPFRPLSEVLAQVHSMPQPREDPAPDIQPQSKPLLQRRSSSR